MLMIPFPFIIAEIFIFFAAVQQWGFWNTLGIYFLPCILGYFIVTIMGQVTLITLQTTVMKGQLPASRLMNSGALFLSGILFLIPSFFSRFLGVVLFLPGLRHLAVWHFKKYLAKKIASGVRGFQFGTGGAGFKYYEFRNEGQGFKDVHQEREVHEANVLDVTPLEITHETRKDEQEKERK